MPKNVFRKFIVFFIFLAGNSCLYAEQHLDKAVFAGGCFWCVESDFEKAQLEGIVDVVSGYTDGPGENPTYEDYAEKGHVEVVQITYDPSKVTYKQLLDVFWRHIDPTDSGGQFVDRGPQYRPAIFYHNEEQKKEAEKSKEELEKSGLYSKPVVTEISEASKFYKADEGHQDYYKKHSIKYKSYRFGSGRDTFLKKIWKDDVPEKKTESQDRGFKKPSDEILKKELTALQYRVTQRNGTEKPFDNLYWDNHREGIYVDIVSGEPLFSSQDKFESGTGWPSFTKPLEPENIVEKKERSLLFLFSPRTEVRSKQGDSHLGHILNDGPPPAGLRYCINSAALRFISKEDLAEKGYGEYEQLFKK